VIAARWIGLLLSMTSAAASAHHGKDFLLTESYEVPHPGDLYLLSTLEYERDDAIDSLALEPSLLAGVIPRLAFELHGHFAKEEGDSMRYEAIAPALHYQVTSPDSDFPVRLGIAAEYEIARGNSEERDRFEGRLILEHQFDGSKIAVNLIGEREAGSNPIAGYAAGYRIEQGTRIAYGLEAQGQFERNAQHDLLLGIYFEPVENFTLKLGAGAAIRREDAGFVAFAGVVLRPFSSTGR